MFDTNNKKKFRLIHSGTLSAKDNMAIDKVLFDNFSNTLRPVIRLYTWEKSFTFGMSSSILDIKDKKELAPYKNNYAKRMTGGGILFHGNDISYSLIIPSSFMKGMSVKQSYEKICKFLLHFYKELGLDAVYAKDDVSLQTSKNEFCQLGFEDYDIVINGLKIGGNAQRRSKDVIFQHGSIGLFKLDDSLHSGNSLKDFGVELSYEEVAQKLIQSFELSFELVLEDSILDEEEEKQLEALLKKEAL